MEVNRLYDLLDNYLEKYPTQEVALAAKKQGQWRKYSIQEYVEITNLLSYGMLKSGIEPGDKVGIVSGNRPEWNMLDFGRLPLLFTCLCRSTSLSCSTRTRRKNYRSYQSLRHKRT